MQFISNKQKHIEINEKKNENHTLSNLKTINSYNIRFDRLTYFDIYVEDIKFSNSLVAHNEHSFLLLNIVSKYWDDCKEIFLWLGCPFNPNKHSFAIFGTSAVNSISFRLWCVRERMQVQQVILLPILSFCIDLKGILNINFFYYICKNLQLKLLLLRSPLGKNFLQFLIVYIKGVGGTVSFNVQNSLIPIKTSICFIYAGHMYNIIHIDVGSNNYLLYTYILMNFFTSLLTYSITTKCYLWVSVVFYFEFFGG